MIGIFDSGIGGLGTAQKIRQNAPEADLVYFGDLANMPYGPKSTEELFRLTLRAMAFVRAQGANEFVAACNSVSVSVITPILDMFGKSNTIVIEMVGPTAKALRTRARGTVLVGATLATVRSGMYERAFEKEGIPTEMIALPELARAIEESADEMKLQTIIAPAVEKAIAIGAKTFVFGCTQYPFIRETFARAFASKQYEIELYDPSDAVAQEAVHRCDVRGSGLNTFFVSKSSEVFEKTVKQLFGDSISVECVDVDKIVDKSVDQRWTTDAFQTCRTLSE